jgi:hypothetical protein
MACYFRAALNPFCVRKNYSFERLIKRVANLFEKFPRRSYCLAANIPKQSKPEVLAVTGGIESLG